MSNRDDDFGATWFPPPVPQKKLGRAVVPGPVRIAPPKAVVTKSLGRTYVSPTVTIVAKPKAPALLPPPVPMKGLGRASTPVLSSLPKAVAKEAAIASAATIASPTYQPYEQSGGGGGISSAAIPNYPAPAPEPEQQDDGSGWVPPDDQSAMLAPMKTSSIVAPLTIAAPAVKASWWTRFLAFFGIGKKAETTVHGEPSSLREMVESVVRRARNRDQNAMALMAMVRDNAKAGMPRAQETMMLFNEYIRCNPVTNPRIGLEPDYVALTQAAGGVRQDSLGADAVALSHGPLLSNPRIAAFLSRFNGEHQEAIQFGLDHGIHASERAHHPSVSHAIRMGKILNQARRLQAVRMRGSSLHAFNADVGWELD